MICLQSGLRILYAPHVQEIYKGQHFENQFQAMTFDWSVTYVTCRVSQWWWWWWSWLWWKITLSGGSREGSACEGPSWLCLFSSELFCWLCSSSDLSRFKKSQFLSKTKNPNNEYEGDVMVVPKSRPLEVGANFCSKFENNRNEVESCHVANISQSRWTFAQFARCTISFN